jgi:pimeloyl-ACP methyl ester carboxylesterase
MSADCRQIRLRDGRALAYSEYGSPDGQPILHCHGAPSSRVEGNLLFDNTALVDLGVRVIIPDRPGIGGSDFQPGRRIVDWPSDVLELTAALSIDQFAVLGESGGSPYAAACAMFIPTRVRSLGLIGCVAPLDAPGVFAAMHQPLKAMFWIARRARPILSPLLALNLRLASSREAATRMAASFPEPDRSLMQQRPEVGPGFVACFVEACRRGTRGPAWDMGLIARGWGFDPSQIRVPTLLWHGERDGNVPAAHGRYLAKVIPNCGAAFYPGEGHLSLPLNHHREMLTALLAAAAPNV